MKTDFTPAQLQDPDTGECNRILRNCVHCGFCLPTCPTYRLSGNELDSPRGRIYLIKEMLEKEAAPSAEVVRHIDQCLSCLSCVTTCPSGVDYMHLIDHGRAWIEAHYRRPLLDRIKRGLIAALLPQPGRLRLLLRLARPAAHLRPLLPGRLRSIAGLAFSPAMAPARESLQPLYEAPSPVKGRVGLLAGCVQQATGNGINMATIRVLNRCGYSVRILTDSDCCGALEHHLGKTARARARIAGNTRQWHDCIITEGLQALIINASGCGTMLKDYGHILAGDPDLAAAAQTVSRMTCDITEFLHGQVPLPTPAPAGPARNLRVACHIPCSLQHGQGIVDKPASLLAACGYRVVPVRDGHLCCGSAGSYNLLQPEIAAQLGQNKAQALEAAQPDVVATGNLGCLIHIGSYTNIPIVHTVQLLDWAGGGPAPFGK